MINQGYFKDKKITVVGLARSGVACANLLYDLGAKVSVTDIKDDDATQKNRLLLKSQDIQVELGAHSLAFIEARDLIVISPGVDDKSDAVVLANKLHIPIISEIEVGWILCPATIIAVTGSNGKTTVTTLIANLLNKSGRQAFVCGNIGNPFCADVASMKPGDFVSLEVSSFQLEKINTFKPKVAIILNFSRNHLDRYKDMREYFIAKKRIFKNQDKEDFLILNADDHVSKEITSEAKSAVNFFQRSLELNPNQAAVMAVAGVLGIDKKIAQEVFDEFKGIEHRMEYVAEVNNIRFVNDSKATTVDSALWALSSINSKIILIAGGKDKGSDYRLILEEALSKVKSIVLIGEAKAKIRSALSGFPAISDAATLEEAVRIAYSQASPGDNILFSPMCSSFDMFRDYEERGKVFKRAVLALVKG